MIIKDLVLHPNHIKKLVSSKTPSGRASKTEIKVEILTKIFLKAKNTNNLNYIKYGLGYFGSVSSKRTIKSTLKFLESLGYISRVIKTFSDGKKIKRILYIKLELENIVNALKTKGIGYYNEKAIKGKKLPINRDNLLYIINKVNNDSNDNINILNINNNLPSSNINNNIQSSTPINTLNTLNTSLLYPSQEARLKLHIKKLFKEEGIEMSCLPTEYNSKYKTFLYTAKEVVITETLLKKINTLANTDFNIEVLETILYNSRAFFSDAKSLINYLVYCFTKKLPAEKQIEMFKKIGISRVVKDEHDDINANCRVYYNYTSILVQANKIKEVTEKGYISKENISFSELKHPGNSVSQSYLLAENPNNRCYIITEEEFYQYIKNGIKALHILKSGYIVDLTSYQNID
jgi:hypothetical protein